VSTIIQSDQNRIKLCFLGTGTSQGVPVIACNCDTCRSNDTRDKRLRTSVLIETPDATLTIDAGPDFRQQMLREKVKKLDAILITHDHKDHIGGLDDVRAFNWIHQCPLDVYGSNQSLDSIKRELPYAFEADKYPGVPEINLLPVDGSTFYIKKLKIIPIKAMHLNLPVLGFRIGNISYLTDANSISAAEADKMRGSEIIIVNALRREKHISHFNLEEAINLLTELSPKHGYITHLSHQMGLHAELLKELPSFIKPAYDGLWINA